MPLDVQSGVKGGQREGGQPCSPHDRWPRAKPKQWVRAQGRLGYKPFGKRAGLPGPLWDWGGARLWVTGSVAGWVAVLFSKAPVWEQDLVCRAG